MTTLRSVICVITHCTVWRYILQYTLVITLIVTWNCSDVHISTFIRIKQTVWRYILQHTLVRNLNTNSDIKKYTLVWKHFRDQCEHPMFTLVNGDKPLKCYLCDWILTCTVVLYEDTVYSTHLWETLIVTSNCTDVNSSSFIRIKQTL